MRTLDSYSVHTSHDAEAVFSLWADPARWPSWDTEVREVTFEGPAAVGARGRMRPASGPAAPFLIVTVEPNRVFTNKSPLPGATLVFDHRVTSTAEGASIEVVVSVDGLLAPIWQRILRKGLGHAARSSVTGLLHHLDTAA